MGPTRFYSRLDFDELSLIPQLSEISPEAVDVSFKFASRVYKHCPFLPSPMDSVVSPALSQEICRLGGIVTLPTADWDLNKWQDHYKTALYAQRNNAQLGVLLPPVPSIIDAWLEQVDGHIDFVALDTLHFQPHLHLTAIRHLRKNCSDLAIISGNVTEKDGALRLIDAGVDAVRVGMTSASINRGEQLTGCARSQLAAVLDCAQPCRDARIPLICDGGIASPDRAVKAFALGASAVMMGASFAATIESAAPLIQEDGDFYKLYAGMSQVGKISSELMAEGVSRRLTPSGTVEDLLSHWSSVCRIAISRAGATSIEQLHSKCTFEVSAITERRW
ncbi:IMP dehydrogenase [Pseudomonas sp. M47T1]|uniref:IMP dehydrogenase n=1 Tax=Pseudomonas sp. M47T1 TaxID=1179778 RepID=UPI0009D9D82B|nr:IMP dehydrogenase [Pseudomonas sp. M47T1]